ncbi:MAG: hypothetical protein ACYCW6_17810 [Candidatus Xenobia bacterium]
MHDYQTESQCVCELRLEVRRLHGDVAACGRQVWRLRDAWTAQEALEAGVAASAGVADVHRLLLATNQARHLARRRTIDDQALLLAASVLLQTKKGVRQ